MIHLHAEGIQHLDLAARNVLITRDTQVKICDFGLSRSKKFNDVPTYGPIKWMAPELIYQREVTHKCDVYSFGITLYEIVTHLDPHPTLTNQEVVNNIQNGLRPSIPSDCPKTLEVMMRMCWEANPNNRPTFTQILEILKDWLNNPNAL